MNNTPYSNIYQEYPDMTDDKIFTIHTRCLNTFQLYYDKDKKMFIVFEGFGDKYRQYISLHDAFDIVYRLIKKTMYESINIVEDHLPSEFFLNPIEEFIKTMLTKYKAEDIGSIVKDYSKIGKIDE